MSFSEVFIRRPVATTLLTLGLTLAGILAFRQLPVSALPQVDFPTISVQASLPGADPETMATSVAAPLERQFGRISGVTEMTSTSYRGTTSINLQFELNRNIDGAARDVQAAINAARGYMPPNMPNNPTYRKINPADAPILLLAMTSDTVTRAKMYDVASTVLQQKLSQVSGVGQVVVGGGSLPAVRVELNPDALNQYGIGLETVRAMLAKTNVSLPKGQIDDAGRVFELEANDQLFAAWQYAPLIVTYRNGAPVRLSDVASVTDSVEDVRTAGLVDGKQSVMLIIFRQPGANIIETVDNVNELLPHLKQLLPDRVDLATVMDRTPPIRSSLRDVEFSLIASCLLVILVVFVFLRSFRATLIPGVAVVVSLIGTFTIMYLLDYSLDNLSLMALTIATGFVVDDAIVVLENISRHKERGESPLTASIYGSREITFTVLSMSISLVAVFIPLLLMGGMVGRLFREFAMTLSAAIFVSLVLSLTATPMMCATILSRKERAPGYFLRLSERGFEKMLAGYEKSLGWALGHPRIMLGLTLSTIVLNVYLYSAVPKGFFPQQDTGRAMAAIQAAQDVSFQAMEQKLKQVVDIIRTDPDVEHVAGFTGGGGGGGATTNTARMFVTLKPKDKRSGSSEDMLNRLRRRLAVVPGAATFLQMVQDLRVGGRASNALYQYTLQGDSINELNTWAPKILQEMRGLKEVTDLNSDQQDKGLQSNLVIDRPTAARLGISPKTIDNVLYDAFGQSQVAVTYTPLNQYHVIMEVDPRYWQDPDTLKRIYIPATGGEMTPLSAFTRFEPNYTTLSVNHQSQFPSVTISFNLTEGNSLGQAVQAINEAVHKLGMPASLTASFQGTAQAFRDSLNNQPLLILAALLTVYVVLGVLYESYIHPLTILSTLPSAGVGAVLALMIFKMELSVIAIIGILLLIGIVKKNGIMMVDFALVAERNEGKTPAEAIYQACVLRFRPIMMTTMAALLGALPLAVGTGTGAELRRPLGVTIIGGLVVSQMLTLYTTPVIYLYLDRLQNWLASRRSAKLGAQHSS